MQTLLRALPALALIACSSPPEAADGGGIDAAASAPPASADAGAPLGIEDAGPVDAGPIDAGSDASPRDLDPAALHAETREELLALFTIRPSPKRAAGAEAFLAKTFDVGAPTRTNHGNKALAKHAIARAQCLSGLAGVTFQTPEQRSTCGGLENMVPIHAGGDGANAKACIDVFEFPNRACELPMVWIGPTQAKMVCELEGKRLCTAEEWVLACGGDPEGGKPSKYAYGDTLDLEACNTGKPAATFGPNCDPDSIATAWKTCATNTEPSGAFPRCRSRFGVFDLHGNVAEIMTRFDVEENHTVSQLKGSAFFYVDVARDEKGKPPKGSPPRPPQKDEQEWRRETYPDLCAHDPRWHVEPMSKAWHVNYHLGFRCCTTVR